MPEKPLTLSTLPMWKCCEHCKDAYCPDRAGHYAPCTFGDCQDGRDLMEKK